MICIGNGKDESVICIGNGKDESVICIGNGKDESAICIGNGKDESVICIGNRRNESSAISEIIAHQQKIAQGEANSIYHEIYFVALVLIF